MKYTIQGFSQFELCSMGLDCIDASILRWILDFYHTGRMQIGEINDKRYFWISYKYLMDDMPIIGIKTKQALRRRLLKFEQCGLMESECWRNNQGTFTYYRFVQEKLSKLVGGQFLRTEPKSSGGGELKSSPKDPSTILNPSTNEQEIPSLKKSTLKMDASVLEKEQKKYSKEVKRDNTKIAEFISSSTDLPVRQCYAHAGKMIKQYGYELTLSIISKIETADISYIYGALRSQAENNGDFEYSNQSIIQNLASMCEG